MRVNSEAIFLGVCYTSIRSCTAVYAYKLFGASLGCALVWRDIFGSCGSFDVNFLSLSYGRHLHLISYLLLFHLLMAHCASLICLSFSPSLQSSSIFIGIVFVFAYLFRSH
ncbi:hypothetical protein, unlikely [Trypanosoma brucei gambiense DAL972]|uniref:Uncharacterized protein n=1 Tax=Trypanosoma brucei gambiense (strain MHOM/CI/86/DAL972) TaxID=679716 RepID=C9ZQ68_TRYB9|nr:hypothetical protein, unlikely [Trypanosoma brucei gambiense DAL972]CBH11548.1 hypothetical protein, unlikely [Trypanosoma brucei gambiense DAL972]|eukprot:XP_011773833.1 hypothetical protein, unlikely [Trypanosoma brucei gambiense DAL972]